jgi:hypothetical protein
VAEIATVTVINKEHVVPDNTIVVVPHVKGDKSYLDIVSPLKGKAKRKWFDPAFYYCLPLTVGNQYGFVIKSVRRFLVEWSGGKAPANITFLDNSDDRHQSVENVFGNGIVTIQNKFTLRTPPGVNLMTIQPPNIFNPYMSSMTGVVESDNLGRDFTFSVKMTAPGKLVVDKGDVFAAFMPIPRYFVEKFELKDISDLFDETVVNDEMAEFDRLVTLRKTEDVGKKHNSGRLYFYGTDSQGNKYKDHQGGSLNGS